MAYESNFLLNTLSYKEIVRWAYQMNLTPDLIPPDDMVFVYKNLVREQEEELKDKTDKDSLIMKKAGMIDYTGFKKAIVRVSFLGLEKLGAGDEGKLQEVLAAKKKKHDDHRATLDQANKSLLDQEAEKKKKMDFLR